MAGEAEEIQEDQIDEESNGAAQEEGGGDASDGKATPKKTRKKKRKKKKDESPDKESNPTSKLSRGVRLKNAIKMARENFRLIFSSLWDESQGTRRMAYVFFFALFGVMGILLFASQHYSGKVTESLVDESAPDAGKNLGKIFSEASKDAYLRRSRLGLGNFLFKLDSEALEKDGTIPGYLGMVEIEIFVECDSIETCDLMTNNIDRVRDQVHRAVTRVERTRVMSLEGKRQLKKTIKRKINLWLPTGRVKQIFFTHIHLG